MYDWKVADFETYLPTHPRILVLFEAGWCPTSSSALQTLQSLLTHHSEKLNELGLSIAKVSGADEAEADHFRNILAIEEYPHISLFLHGAQVRYLSQIDDTSALISFLEAHAHSDSREASVESIKISLFKDGRNVLVFTGTKSHPRFATFLEACLHFQEVVCFHGGNHEVLENWKLRANQLYLFSGDQGKHIQYKTGWRRERLFTWIHEHTVLLFPELDDAYLERIFDQQTPTIFLLLGPDGQPEEDKIEDTKLLSFLRENPQLFSSKYLSSYCKQGDSRCNQLISRLPARITHPSLFLILFHPEIDEPLVFLYDHHEINRNLIESWISDVQKGRVMMEYTSETTEIQTDGLIKMGYREIKEYVGGAEDILIVFGGNSFFESSDWQRLRSELSEIVSQMMKNNISGLKIAFFNTSNNSHYSLSIPTSPQLRLYRKHELPPASTLQLKPIPSQSAILDWLSETSSRDLQSLLASSLDQEDI
jgi:Thioredoxin-like domain